MKAMYKIILLSLLMTLCTTVVLGQEKDISGVELSIDQDKFADFLRDTIMENRNYAISLRLGIYGAYANHDYLGLPWVRKRIDGFLVDRLLYRLGFSEESESHNFTFTINGFSPSHISDETDLFAREVAAGYDLSNDRPFSSFTGFRSTRRLQGIKRFVHSAKVTDFAISTSFTFGFASFGIAQSVENLFGGKRPDGNLWDRNTDKPYPTGQVMRKGMPVFMYSISAEAVVWKPLRKVLVQVRPELNLGYYTNFGLGIDFGKVMNVDRHIDNLSYTDTHNPGLISVNNENIALSVVGGVMARAVAYNAHLHGYFGWNPQHYITYDNVKKIIFEGYLGVKIQLFKKIEFNYSINRRSREFISPLERAPLWGTIGLKYLLAPEGEGCFE